jgi:uncharacterized protein (TIGR02391 family)
MNLETKLEPKLWEAVRASLEARNFTAAILDGMHLLSDVIRERSGLEGDGVSLVGAAFGGSSPKLKVNRMQTESQQNEQRGVEALLRGLYQAIRNPRSHGAHRDEERDADAILLFVGYLLRIVDQSRNPFSLPVIVARVLDPDFVPDGRYAKLLVDEIPANRRLMTCREILARRSDADAGKIKFFFAAIVGAMPSEEVGELCEVVSEELRQTEDDDTVFFVVRSFPPDLWPRLHEAARLRIENKLIRSVRIGKYSAEQKRCSGGVLGTWATNIIEHFTLKDEIWSALTEKLGSPDREEQDYVFTFFMRYLDRCYDAPPGFLVWVVNRGLKAGDSRFKEAVELWQVDQFLEDQERQDSWTKPFVEALGSFAPAPEANEPPEITDEEVPF